MRKAFVLTCDPSSARSLFSKNILEKVGFNVIFFKCIPNDNKVLSNKISMLKIYEIIKNGDDEWAYVFEDDINILQDIDITEIIQYELISTHFFYLGVCIPNYNHYELFNNVQIKGHRINMVTGGVRGLHAIALSKLGAKKLLAFEQNYKNYQYMDMILEKFSEKYPANVVRYDLQSYIYGHRGIFFQDRIRFPSSI
jgi:hypothetical protein